MWATMLSAFKGSVLMMGQSITAGFRVCQPPKWALALGMALGLERPEHAEAA
jgi:hypothetical protein